MQNVHNKSSNVPHGGNQVDIDFILRNIVKKLICNYLQIALPFIYHRINDQIDSFYKSNYSYSFRFYL